jgi:hypothetical protein
VVAQVWFLDVFIIVQLSTQLPDVSHQESDVHVKESQLQSRGDVRYPPDVSVATLVVKALVQDRDRPEKENRSRYSIACYEYHIVSKCLVFVVPVIHHTANLCDENVHSIGETKNSRVFGNPETKQRNDVMGDELLIPG